MNFLITVTHTTTYRAEADSPEQARALAESLVIPGECVLHERVDTSVRRDPPLMLPHITEREYKVEYLHNGALKYEQSIRRTSAKAVRDRARTVGDAIAAVVKCSPSSIELRVRELEPRPMLHTRRQT